MLTEVQFNATITAGQVYYFSSDQISSPEKHYFVVIHHYINKFGIAVYFLCCTTKYHRRIRFFEMNDIPMSCLVEIDCDDRNQLTARSWIDCNSNQTYFSNDLYEMYTTGDLEIKGVLTEVQLNLIRKGIKESPMVEEDKKIIFLP